MAQERPAARSHCHPRHAAQRDALCHPPQRDAHGRSLGALPHRRRRLAGSAATARPGALPGTHGLPRFGQGQGRRIFPHAGAHRPALRFGHQRLHRPGRDHLPVRPAAFGRSLAGHCLHTFARNRQQPHHRARRRQGGIRRGGLGTAAARRAVVPVGPDAAGIPAWRQARGAAAAWRRRRDSARLGGGAAGLLPRLLPA